MSENHQQYLNKVSDQFIERIKGIPTHIVIESVSPVSETCVVHIRTKTMPTMSVKLKAPEVYLYDNGKPYKFVGENMTTSGLDDVTGKKITMIHVRDKLPLGTGVAFMEQKRHRINLLDSTDSQNPIIVESLENMENYS